MTKTEKNLEEAFAGESQASRRYLFFADKADSEGHPQIARLFRAAVQAETVHARNHLRVLGGIGSTAENLRGSIDGEEYEFQLPDSGPEPDTVLQRKEALERLEEVIAELPPHYRAITLLRHDQQLSYEEIAEILQLPLGTVKARIHRARNQIQQMLSARSYDI